MTWEVATKREALECGPTLSLLAFGGRWTRSNFQSAPDGFSSLSCCPDLGISPIRAEEAAELAEELRPAGRIDVQKAPHSSAAAVATYPALTLGKACLLYLGPAPKTREVAQKPFVSYLSLEQDWPRKNGGPTAPVFSRQKPHRFGFACSRAHWRHIS